MPEEEPAAAGRDAPGGEHQLWLAMQAAHKQYRNASTALDALTAMSPGEFPSSERNLQIEMVAAEERASFENYIETRLQLSELLLSRRMIEPVHPAVSTDTAQLAAHRPGISAMAALAVLAAFLFPTAFGIGYLARQRNQVRHLEEARDELSTTLSQTRTEVQGLARKLETLKTVRQAVVRPPVQRNLAKRKVLASTKRARPVQTATRVPTPTSGIVARNHDELLLLQRRGQRNYHEFTVTSRRHFERIGPINMTVLDVDPHRKVFDVAIAVDNLAPNRKRLNLYEPIWIDLKDNRGAVELVFNGIDGDEVQGYFSEPKYPRMGWRQASPTNSTVALAAP
jgi:hypothetical protein